MEKCKIGKEYFDDFESFGRRCGCPRPSYVRRNQVDARMREFRAMNDIFRSSTDEITIPIQFIHITDGVAGNINAQQRSDQVRVLNNDFVPHNISFTYKEQDTITEDNADWFRMGHGSAAERAAKTALQANPEKTLNFYTTNGGSLLGWATFPWEQEGDPILDGVVCVFSSLPNIGEPPYNLGRTATHEIGHWLGLYHTFQGGCNATGDHVGDTVAHSGPNYGKPTVGERHNACSSGELAPVNNYMNYVDDDWMNRFTSEQAQRMRDNIGAFRPDLLEVAAPTLSSCYKRVSRVLQ